MQRHIAYWFSTLMLILLLFIVVNSRNSWNVDNPDASLMISMGADVTRYPNRNCRLPYKSVNSNISPSIKVRAGIKLLNASLYAYSLVLLAEDVSRNPGPTNISLTNDRKNKKGGGCMIYIRDGLPQRSTA